MESPEICYREKAPEAIVWQGLQLKCRKSQLRFHWANLCEKQCRIGASSENLAFYGIWQKKRGIRLTPTTPGFQVHAKFIDQFRQRCSTESIRELLRHPAETATCFKRPSHPSQVTSHTPRFRLQQHRACFARRCPCLPPGKERGASASRSCPCTTASALRRTACSRR